MKLFHLWAVVIVMIAMEQSVCFGENARCEYNKTCETSTDLSYINATQTECKEKCHFNTDCEAYVTSPEGECWLKGDCKGNVTTTENIKTCFLAKRDFRFTCNQTYTCVDNNYQQINLSISSCQAKCYADASCAAFSVGHNRECWLKSQCNRVQMRTDPVIKETCVKVARDGYECTKGDDCPGNDISRYFGNDCDGECNVNAACVSIVFNSYEADAPCFFKHKCVIKTQHSLQITCFKNDFGHSPFAGLTPDEIIFACVANYSCPCNNMEQSFLTTEIGCEKRCKENTTCAGYAMDINEYCFLKSSCFISQLVFNPAINNTCFKGQRGINPVPDLTEFIVKEDIDPTDGMQLCTDLESGINAIYTNLSALSQTCICIDDKILLFEQLKPVQTGSKEFCVDKCEDTMGQMIEQVRVMGATMCNSSPSEYQCFEQVFLALDDFTFNQLMPPYFEITMDDKEPEVEYVQIAKAGKGKN